MLARVSARELREWEAYAMLEPWGDEWRQTGQICREIHNSQITSKSDAATTENYMPLPDLSGLAADDDEEEASDDEGLILVDDDEVPEQSEEEIDRIFRRGGNKVIQ